jgi:hypothetical protein
MKKAPHDNPGDGEHEIDRTKLHFDIGIDSGFNRIQYGVRNSVPQSPHGIRDDEAQGSLFQLPCASP